MAGRYFRGAAGEHPPDTPRDEIGGWDSLGVLTLMAELDDKFEIRMDAEEMKAMTHVRDVLALLERNGALTAE